MLTDKDYFGLFGLPIHYRLDRKRLDEAYQRLILEHHPDFFAMASPEERERADRISARLNEAYRVLTDPVLRTAYLINNMAGDRAVDTKALPKGFLQEMFLLQEEVEELGPSAESPRKDALRAEVAERLDAVREEQEALFESSSGETSLDLVQSMQSNLNRERYLLRLNDALHQEANHHGEA